MAPLMIWMIRLMSIPDMTRHSPIRCEFFGTCRAPGPSPRWHNLSVCDEKVMLRQRRALSRFRAKWIPVSVKNARQIKNLGLRL
jgi:hypothetical protein